jgi:rSAM/selenodomain-associated transferase 2
MAAEAQPIPRPPCEVPISVILPTLNEARGIETRLLALSPLRGAGAEIIVVDGGSRDATEALARPHCDRLLIGPRGRALQMNAGAAAARGALLVFLHADTEAPLETLHGLPGRLAASGRSWGRFDVRIEGSHPLLSVVAWAMNQRSRLTGIATGDQTIFVQRTLFDQIGGYPEIALMEDVVLSKRLRRVGRPLCLRERVVTSGRRWESRGVIRTILLMWALRLAFACGARPSWLAGIYGVGPRTGSDSPEPAGAASRPDQPLG